MLRLSWMISVGISLMGVLLIEHFFTMKANEAGTANGNLGAVGLALVLPFIVLSLFITFRYFTELSWQTKDKILRNCLLLGGFALAAALFYYALEYRKDVYSALGGTTAEKGSIIYGYPMLNEYTNKIFINFYTFAFIHTISAVAGGIFGVTKPKKQTAAAEENEMDGL